MKFLRRKVHLKRSIDDKWGDFIYGSVFIDLKSIDLYWALSIFVLRDGLSVFFRGFTLMSSRAFIVNGVTFVAVEQLNKMCKNDTQR